jgi:hypothetical protein
MPRPFPVHKAVFVGAPPKLTLTCAPNKIVNVVQFMLRQKTAVEEWGGVTCRACLDAKEKK